MSAHSDRIPSLDGLRGIAVLSVMVYHFPKTPTNAIERVVAVLAMPGQTGVDLFFVLSGFLITGILLSSKDVAHPLRTFYLRRSLRIFPLYYAFLAALYFVLPLLGVIRPTGFVQQLWFWSYMQNVGFTFWDIPGPNHFWSLAVEEHFYLLWPLLVIHIDMKHLTRILFGAIGLSVLMRWTLIAGGYGSFYFTLCRLDGLALGGLIAVAAHSPHGVSHVNYLARRFLLLGTIPLALGYGLFSGSQLLVIQIWKSTLIGCVYASMVVVSLNASSNSMLVHFLSTKTLRAFGKYSYAMYIFHPFVFAMLVAKVHAPMIPALVMGIGATYVVALISWSCLERPFLRLRDRFEYVKIGSTVSMHTSEMLV